MDRIINISVGGNYLKKDKKSAGVRGEANVTSLRITFDAGWDNYAKKVTFLDARGLNPVNITLGVNLIEDIAKNKRVYIVPIPAEPMAISGELTFIIEGTLDNKIQKSFADRLEVKDAPDTAGAVNSVDPTPSEIEQMQTEIEFIKETFGKSSYVGEDGVVYVWSDEKGEYVPLQAIKGEDGKTAYEYAKEGGYTGTEAEFIALLNGLTALVNGSHYKDYNNPHKVTAKQTGAIPETYYYSNDLNTELQQGGNKMTVCYYNSGTLNTPKSEGITDYAHGMVITNAHTNEYGSQLCIPSGDNNIYLRRFNKSGITQWSKLSPEDIVKKSGDAMTGALTIVKKTAWGQYVIYSPADHYRAFEADDGRVRIDVRDHHLTTSRRYIDIYSNVGESNFSNAMRLAQTTDDGVNKIATILHSENINDFVISKGSYAGGGATYKTIPIRKTTQMVIVYGMQVNAPYTLGILVRGLNAAHCDIGPSVSNNTTCDVEWNDTKVTVSNTLSQPLYAWNVNGVNYHYVVIG